MGLGLPYCHHFWILIGPSKVEVVVSLFFFFFLIVTIVFKSMASAYDGCSYYQAKKSIDFCYRRDLNPGPLLDDKKLY
jgi:hypothetical protein